VPVRGHRGTEKDRMAKAAALLTYPMVAYIPVCVNERMACRSIASRMLQKGLPVTDWMDTFGQWLDVQGLLNSAH
jgi:hypothetical protein